MAKKDDDIVTYLVIGILCAIVFIVVWRSRPRKYNIPDSIKNRWEDYESTVWKSGASPQACERAYYRCMQGCSQSPSIGCPGQCLEEKEYCQEFEN